MRIETKTSPRVSGSRLFKSLEPVFRKIASSVLEDTEVIEVILVGRRRMTELNRVYKNRNGSAEILTFDYGGDEPVRGEDDVRGEIYLYYGGASRTAEKLGVSVKAYLLRLFVHGICHIMGYSHGNEVEAREMEEVEKRLLRPYLSHEVIDAMI